MIFLIFTFPIASSTNCSISILVVSCNLCFFQFRPKKIYKNSPKGGNIKNISSHAIVFSGFFLSITINIIDIIIFIIKNKENMF